MNDRPHNDHDTSHTFFALLVPPSKPYDPHDTGANPTAPTPPPTVTHDAADRASNFQAGNSLPAPTDFQNASEARTEQAATDQANSAFWNTPCGTTLANALGIVDSSPESLAKFDDWYFKYYPYLDTHIDFMGVRGKAVLEVGLGYGSVSQRLCESGAIYTGLDIAHSPVEMVNYRCALHGGLNGHALKGSILTAPFPDASFDYVVAIGCYHHTGNIQQAIDETYRILKPGGQLSLMVYNGLSYRQWITEFQSTFRRFARLSAPSTVVERGRYDSTLDGAAAPHTDFISTGELQRLCRRFSTFRACLENINQEPPFRRWTREQLLKTPLPRLCGLDIYVSAVK